MNRDYKYQTGYVFDGEPRLIMSDGGVDWEIKGGQPINDAGQENWAFYALFTRPGWWGNKAIKNEFKHGEDCDFDEITEEPLTRSMIIDANKEAERGLKGMVDNGIASSIEANIVPRQGGTGIDFVIKVHSPSGETSQILLQKYGIIQFTTSQPQC